MHRPRRSPGQRFRFEQYIPYLEENGYICDISYIVSAVDDRIVYSAGHYADKLKIFAKAVLIRLNDVLRSNKYDVIFIYREALMVNTGVTEALLARSSARLIFDFDDAIWLQGVSRANARLGWLRGGPSKIPGILRRVDMVFAGNDYLADYARQFSDVVHVIPTTLNTETHAPVARKPNTAVCIGWSGSPSTAPYFDLLARPLTRVKQRFGQQVYYRFIGDETYRCPELGIVGRPWREQTEVEDVAEFDIGLMPLPDDPWSRGKCGFKALLYMSLAIPSVVSPVGANKTIVLDGTTGYHAQNDDDWFEILSALILDVELRSRIGYNGREFVVKYYSLKSQRQRYLHFFDEISNVR